MIIALAVCSTDADPEVIPDGIVIKTAKQTGVGFIFEGAGITVKWGDGTPNSVQDVTPDWFITHNYTDGKAHTITITGKVTKMNCSNIELTSLDVRAAKELVELQCYSNKLTSLNVSKNTALKKLDCAINELTSLNVNGAAALQLLNCFNNELTSLNLSGAPVLLVVDCLNNNLKSLDVSKNTLLFELNCAENDMDGPALNKLFGNLVNRNGLINGNIFIIDNPGLSTCDETIAENKNWVVSFVWP